ncbi:MAG: hypothetical protein AB7K24_02765 [Gemmataceae bacterium]
MNMLRIDFQELFERHLCRHSEFGIIVNHLLCVIGTYYALAGIVFTLSGSAVLVVALALPYLTALAFNVPGKVLAATVVFLGLFFPAFFLVPPLPVWAYALIIFVLYKIQNWSHLYWREARDMTEFNKKYPKGVTLFFLLLLYELPLLLNYLCFARTGRAESASSNDPCEQPAEAISAQGAYAPRAPG